MEIRSAAALIGGLPIILAGHALAQDDAANPGMFRYPDVSGREIVFTYANDLWVVDKTGGAARPLASPPGQETFPKFNADGDEVAFIGNYEGDRDLYISPTMGGVPARITHHPGNERLNDWTPNGLLFSFNAMSGNPAQQQLFFVDPLGGMPEELPIPYGAVGSVNSSGELLAYTPNSRDFRTWKRYRGGLATDIWLYNLNTNEAEQITDWEGTDSAPMWHGDSVYYLSDDGGQDRLNIWRYDTESGRREQITEYTENDVKFPSIGPDDGNGAEIVFQLGSHIHLLDARTGDAEPVEIRVPGARETLRPKRLNAAQNLSTGGISSTGKRIVVEARGDIFTSPAENGPVRQLTSTSGAAERLPEWSPDGRWIAYSADTDGEYEIYITQSDGKGETRQLTDGNKTYWMAMHWSPDSESIVLVDKAGVISLLDVESGDMTRIDKEPMASQPPISWSHDSRWIAYHKAAEHSMLNTVWIYDTENDEHHQATSGFFSDSNPTFSRKGDYLYYTSNRNFSSPEYEDVGSTFVYSDTGRIIAVPLNDGVENKQLLESDEETWEEEEEDESGSEESEEGDAKDDDGESGEDADDAEDGAEDEQDAEDVPEHLRGYDTDHPLWGVWNGAAKGFAAIGAPQDEISFTWTILVDEEGTITGQSAVMGETDDLGDSVTFDPDTGELRIESSEMGVTSIQTGTVEGDTISGSWELEELGVSGSWSAERSTREIDKETIEEIEGDDEEAAETVEIDFENFERRGRELGIAPGNFAQLSSNDKGHLLYMRISGGAPSLKIFDITDDEPSEKTVLGVALGYSISGDGKKIAAATPQGFGIASAAPGQAVKPVSMEFNKVVERREEWRQIVVDAWRRHRDFFYVENMHGVDWEGVLDHYLPMVDDAVSREDVSYIIGEMIGELNVGHAYYFGGDVEPQPSTSVGLLGVDFSVATKNIGGQMRSGFRIETIYEGAPWDSDARNPLTMQGLDIREGDILTHVNGAGVDTTQDPWAAFIDLAGKETNLTFVSDLDPEVAEKIDAERAAEGEDGGESSADDANGDDAENGDDEAYTHERTYTIEPMGSETSLRYRHWVESKRRYVEEASDGKIGYIYVPNTGVQGQNELFRQFYGQMGKEALLIDERWNGGGQIPTRFIELLDRPRTNYFYRRDGRDWPWPYDSHQGPKAMLINGNAGSGGDMFPWLFRENDLGPLVGTRTWGGLVGISTVPGLIDGGYTAVPNFGFYEKDGTWGIEGHGVDPDIKVIDDPSKMLDGNDPQINAAVDHLLEKIKTEGYEPPEPPEPPVRTGIGIEEEDK